MTSTPAPSPQKTEKGTKYVVLKLVKASDEPGDKAGWMTVGGPISAANGNAAIRQRADIKDGGDYVAIPERSWKPVKVTVSTETKVTLG